MIHPVRLPIYAIIALTICQSVAAQAIGAREPTPPDVQLFTDQIDTPAGARRITARFDFEPVPGDATGLPSNWIRAQHDPPTRDRPGFPLWNRGVIDDKVAFAGSGSLRLDTEGGSASMLLDAGLIQVFPDADYAVVARVRTKDVDHARARLVARLIDRAGETIPGSQTSSDPIRTGGTWQHIAVRVPGDHPESISLQIELLLEQPGPDPSFPYQPFEIERQDYQGSAWFDEVAVVQIPRVETWVQQPGNLIPAAAKPTVHVFVRDLVNEPMQVVYTITDARGEIIDEQTVTFNGGRLEADWLPEIDKFGWYAASVTVLRQGVRLGGAETAFVWSCPRSDGSRPSARDASPFSISVENVPAEGLGTLAETALSARTPRVLTTLYASGETPTPERISALGAAANRIAREGGELGIAVDMLPDMVSTVVGPGPIIRAMADPDADGASWLNPILIDLGHRVRWWRAGPLNDAIDTIGSPEILPAAQRLRQMVPGAVVEVSWPAFDAIDPAAIAPGVAIVQPIDPSIIPSEVPKLTDGFVRAIEDAGLTGWNRPDHTAVFIAEEGTDHLAAIHQTVLNAVHAWIGFRRGDHPDPARGRSLRLDRGWTWEHGRHPQLVPSPIAAAWLPLMDTLSGRLAEPLARVAPGVQGVLLTTGSTAGERTEPIALFWSEPGPDHTDSLSLLLGPERVVAADVFGNRTPVEATTLPNSSVRAHTIDLSGGPVFVEGIDPDLLRFLASVRLSPSLVQSMTDPQEVALTIGNPWSSTVQGNFFIVEPGNLSTGTRATQDRRWDIAPRFGPFAIPGGGNAEVPVMFGVSPAIPAGPVRLVVDVDLAAPTVSEFVRVERTIEVGLEDIRMHLVSSFEPDPFGPDLVVYAIIENTGSAAQTVDLSVRAPGGYARQRAASSPVFPGRRMIKAFPFKEGRALLAGEQITAGLTIRSSGRRLRRSITIDDGG